MFGQDLVKPSLMLSKGYPTEPFYLAVYFKIEPEWHLYWKNPGDTGLPIQANVQVSSGYVAQNMDIVYSTPHFLQDDSGISYIFADETMLLIPIKPPTAIRDLPEFSATVVLKWLVCREKCLTGGDTLSIAGSQISDTTLQEMQRTIEQFLPMFPKKESEIPFHIAEGCTLKKGQQYKFMLKFKEKLPSNAVFYPEAFSGWALSYDQITVKEKQITIPATLIIDDKNKAAKLLKGILVVDNVGYNLNVNIEK